MVDATARLYDVNEDSLVFTRLQYKKSYDQGTITFRARKGRLIDLDKLQESIWATRLSGRTSSGLVSFQITAVGKVVETESGPVLRVSNSNAIFRLGRHTDKELRAAYDRLPSIQNGSTVRITGVIDNFRGRWPTLLRQKITQPRRILVTELTVLE